MLIMLRKIKNYLLDKCDSNEKCYNKEKYDCKESKYDCKYDSKEREFPSLIFR